MPILTNDAAKDIVHKREDTLIQGDHSSKAYRYRFEGGAKRHISIARPSRAGGATIYVNRQSTALDWFPVEDSERYFPGVAVSFRYMKGFVGDTGELGLSAAVGTCKTLLPDSNHVLRLLCNDLTGFDKFVRWYAGELSLNAAGPPATDEVSGPGPFIALRRRTDEASAGTNARVDDFSADEVEPPVGGGASDGSPTTDADADDIEADLVRTVMADPARRRAVEQHAVRVATAHYQAREFVVEELGKPFDLLCTPVSGTQVDRPVVHVEVKGSIGAATTVHLTRNEVNDARNAGAWRSDLFIVSRIALIEATQGEGWAACGGISEVHEAWSPSDEDLVPTDFEYRVPR